MYLPESSRFIQMAAIPDEAMMAWCLMQYTQTGKVFVSPNHLNYATLRVGIES